MPSLHLINLSQLTVVVIIPAIFCTLPYTIASAYMFQPNVLTDSTAAQKHSHHQPTSALASKVIFHNPHSMANIYKEFIVASKPLNLRKYHNGSKTKKTKKDSKIYYIPIPPLPYRYIPGVGLDYQPMKIKPIVQEASPMPASIAGISDIAHVTTNFDEKSTDKHRQQTPTPVSGVSENNIKTQISNNNLQNAAANAFTTKYPSQSQANLIGTSSGSAGESKLYRMHRGDYYFNGRPFRLQVAHAQPKNQLTPQNLKSKFYFNKNFIY